MKIILTLLIKELLQSIGEELKQKGKYKMITYREKPKTINVVIWTGDNLDEVKAFLGDCFVGVTSGNWIKYKTSNRSITTGYLRPIKDVLYKDDVFDSFEDTDREQFERKWERAER